MIVLYSIVAEIVYLFIRFMSLFEKWAKRLMKGRKNLIRDVKKSINPNEDIAWFHCASLGEFEQVQELIESFKQHNPSYKILLTFFSPSGYEVKKNYEKADYVFYIPIDTYVFSKHFVKAINPKIVVIVKYEFWVNLINHIKKNGSQLILISAIFKKNYVFFKWYGSIFRETLRKFDKIFVQDFLSQQLLEKIEINNCEIAGDTRFDRVHKSAINLIDLPIVSSFCATSKAVIFGSSWERDHLIAIDFIKHNPKEKVIIVPHQINRDSIENLCNSIEKIGARLTKYSSNPVPSTLKECNVLIIDNIGLLSQIYQYGKFAHIGGGFSAGIHNTIEAAAFGLPLTFGPNYGKFKEAIDLVELNVAKPITKYAQLQQWFDELTANRELYNQISRIEIEYVEKNCGACEKILNWIDKSIGEP